MNSDSAFEALALVIDALRDSAKLQTWFAELAHMSDSKRRDAIARTTLEMKALREPDDLVTTFGLLADPRLYGAVASALRDCGIRL